MLIDEARQRVGGQRSSFRAEAAAVTISLRVLASNSDGTDLPPGARTLTDAVEKFLVVAPSLPTRTDRLTSTPTGRPAHAPRGDFQSVVEQLDELGVRPMARRETDDPLEAVEGALRSLARSPMIALSPVGRSGGGWSASSSGSASR
jgi:hypothetical protein